MVVGAASEPAEERDADLGDLVAVLAHDMKNALAALTANLHYLDGSLGQSDDPDCAEALSDSVTLCQALDHFLRNLDLLGRHKRVTTQSSPTPLLALATQAASRFERQAGASGVELLVEAPDGEDALAFVDRDLFLRAAENLVANAVENAPKGSKIVLEIEAGDRESSLTVIDARSAAPPPLLPPKDAGGHRGRGLTMVCADIAARAGGGRLLRSGKPGECRLRLVAPARDVEERSA